MQAGAYAWFMERVQSGSKEFTCYIGCGDTFHARRLDRSSVDEPGTLFDIRVALECMLETQPENGKWELTVEEINKNILRVTFRSAAIQ